MPLANTLDAINPLPWPWMVVFWTAAAVLVYALVGYPLIVRLVARALPRPGSTPQDPVDPPTVTLVIPAYNEEAVLQTKLENALTLDYPRERLEILVASDGSTDGTLEIAQSFENRGVKVLALSERRGKPAVLNDAVREARREVLCLCDANTLFQPDALKRLVARLDDPKVGAVSGDVRLASEESDFAEGESAYYRLERTVQRAESKVGSMMGVDGGMYVLRRELFQPLRDDDIADTILPLKIVARGFRGVFDEEAVCYERTAEDFAGEFRRRARIVNRALGAVLRVPQTLNPFRVGVFAYQLAVHKLLRWFVPFFLIAMLVASTYLAARGHETYVVLLAMQLLFYGVALLGFVPGVRHWKPVYITYYFCLANTAAALGIIRLVLGKRIATWSPERAQLPSGGQASDADESCRPGRVSAIPAAGAREPEGL